MVNVAGGIHAGAVPVGRAVKILEPALDKTGSPVPSERERF